MQSIRDTACSPKQKIKFSNIIPQQTNAHTPPYITRFLTICSRASEALFSSISAGWFQCSAGISPNCTSASVSSVTRLSGGHNQRYRIRVVG